MKKIAFSLAVILALLSTTAAFAAGTLNLPATPVTITHGPWLGNSPNSTIAITLSNVPAGFDVTDGTYNGWCIEDNGKDNAPQASGVLTQPSGSPWDKINWVLNNWNAYGNYYDAQIAIWLLTGTNQSLVTPAAQALYDAANANGTGFTPGAGQKVAVITFSDNAVSDQYQDTIIEVILPGDGGGPGTGTPGYWKNHPEAWPVDSVIINEDTYSKANAIALMGTPENGDKTYTVFRAYVAAYLNGQIGNDTSCVTNELMAAYNWLDIHEVGSNVPAKSQAWKDIQAAATTLDNYNNGLLCAPHRD